MAKVLGKFVKTTADYKRYTISYSDWLDTGELLTGVTLSHDAALTSTVPVLSTDSKSVSFFIGAGLDDVTYKVLAIANTDGGQIQEDEIVFVVRDF